MLVLSILFMLLAAFVLVSKRPRRPPEESPEYRLDNRVVASILALLAISFAVLAWITGKYLL